MLISILMSKIVFIKYLPYFRLKLIPKLKNAQNLLKFVSFDISNIPIWILMSKIFLMKYLPPATPKLVLKLKVPRVYLNLADLILQIRESQL